MAGIYDVLKRIADHNVAGAHGRTNLDGVTERDAAIAVHAALVASHGRTNLDGVTERDAAIAVHAALVASHGRTNLDGVTERDAAIAAHAALNIAAGVHPNANISAYGSYVGDSTANRAVAHGLGRIPILAVIVRADGAIYFIIRGISLIIFPNGGFSFSVTAMDATNFYVGNASDYSRSGNLTANTHYYVIFG